MEWIALWIGLVGLIAWLLAGIRIVPQPERWVVELFGRYFRTFNPGLRCILPGVMRIRESVDVREQKFPLFGITPIKIDFKDGSATPRGTEGWVRVKNPDTREYPVGILGRKMTGVERVVYEIKDWKIGVTDLLENALRSYLNTLTIDEGISKAKAGFDLKNQFPSEEQGRLKETLTYWGLELMRVTIMDFDLEPDLVKARGEVQIRQREAEAAGHLARKRAIETVGAVVRMMAESRNRPVEEMQGLINIDPELQKEFLSLSKDLIRRQMAIDGRSFIDIRVEGAEGLERTLLNLLAAWKRMSMGAPGESPTKESVGEAIEKPGEKRPTESILADLTSWAKKATKTKPRKLTEQEGTKIREELKSLPEEQAKQWREWILQMTARGYLKT